MSKKKSNKDWVKQKPESPEFYPSDSFKAMQAERDKEAALWLAKHTQEIPAVLVDKDFLGSRPTSASKGSVAYNRIIGEDRGEDIYTEEAKEGKKFVPNTGKHSSSIYGEEPKGKSAGRMSRTIPKDKLVSDITGLSVAGMLGPDKDQRSVRGDLAEYGLGASDSEDDGSGSNQNLKTLGDLVGMESHFSEDYFDADGGERISAELGMGKMGVLDKQAFRFNHMDAMTKIVAKAALTGNFESFELHGQRVNLDWSKAGISVENLEKASSAFGSVIGSSPNTFASQIKVGKSEMPSDILIKEHSDSITGAYGGEVAEYKINPTVLDPKIYRTVYSMLGKTASIYAESGSSDLPGEHYDLELNEEYNTDKYGAFATLTKLAETYVPQDVTGARRTNKVKEVETALYKRFTETRYEDRRTDTTLGYDMQWSEDLLIATPAELNISGLIKQLSWGGKSVAGTRKEWEEGEEDRAQRRLATLSKMGLSPSTKEGRAELISLEYNDSFSKPSPKRSLLSGFKKEERDDVWKGLVTDVKAMSTHLSQFAVGTLEEATSTKHSPGYSLQNPDQADRANAVDLAYREDLSGYEGVDERVGEEHLLKFRDENNYLVSLDIGRARKYKTHKFTDAIGSQAKALDIGLAGLGRGSQSMYGMKENSEIGDFLYAMNELGLSDEDSVAYAKGELEDKQKVEYSFGVSAETPKFLMVPTHQPKAGTAHAEYLARPKGPKQGTPEWLAQRAGKPSASAASTIASKRGVIGKLKLERQLAEQKLGLAVTDDLPKSWEMGEGNKWESKAMRAFLRSDKGLGLVAEEAFFEENPDFPGMGASPDARLFNKATGESEGLLELKVLQSDESIKGSVAKYRWQRQFQMMITGEEQTHFAVYDPKQGETHYFLDRENELMQKELAANSKDLVERLARATPETIELITKQIEAAQMKRSKNLAKGERNSKTSKESEELALNLQGEDTDDDAESYAPRSTTALKDSTKQPLHDAAAKEARHVKEVNRIKAEAAKIKAAYEKERAKLIAEGRASDSAKNLGNVASGTILAEGMIQEEQRDLKKSALAQAKAPTDAPMDAATEQFREAEKSANKELKDAQKREKAEETAAHKESMEASKQASLALMAFNQTVKNAASTLSTIGKIMTGGNDTVMDTVRLAEKIGMGDSEDNVRGMQFLLSSKGGLTAAEADKDIQTVGKQALSFRNAQVAANEQVRVATAFGKDTESDAVKNLPKLTVNQMQNMDAQDRYSYIIGLVNSLDSSEDKAYVSEVFGVSAAMVGRKVTADEVSNATYNLNKDGAEAFYETRRGVEQGVQGLQETVNEAGDTGGFVAAAATIGGAVIGAVGGAYGAYRSLGATRRAMASSSANQKALSSASPKGSTPSNVKATAPNAVSRVASSVKATSPIGLLAAAAPAVARPLLNIEDDGSLNDSAMDIAEMGAYGAILGSVIPVAGTAVGGVIGAAVGVVNEGYEYFAGESVMDTARGWFSSDDSYPSSSIGKIPATEAPQPRPTLNSNVDVVVNVSKDRVDTEVNDNGENYFSSEYQ